MKRIYLAVGFVALLGGAAFLWSNWGSGSGGSGRPGAAGGGRPAQAVPVVAAAVVQKPMPVQVSAIGTVQTIASVVVRARADTQIEKVLFKEGDAVKAGDILFELDKRQVSAQIAQAEAQAARDRALLANAKRDVERYTALLARDYASHQQTDTAKANAASLEATVRADEAAVENLRVQQSYYTIRAPISGRTGSVNLKEGNVVKGNDTATASALVTINQMDPIYVAFSVPQQVLGELRQAQQAGPVPVDASINSAGVHDQGQVTFIDNTIDVASGTITVKATVPNADEKLWPGQFVDVNMTLRIEPDALVVPATAIQIGQNGNYVFVIKPDHTVEPHPVKVSRTVGLEAVIADGLEVGQQVVVDGQLRLTNGSHVEIRPAAGSSSGVTAGSTPGAG